MKTTVANKHHLQGIPWETRPEFQYIGRGSMFGNPFVLQPGKPRGSTLAKFKKYFYDKLAEDKHFREAVHTLYGKTLVCFCKPHPCHGDIIAEYLEEYHDQKVSR